DHHLRAGHGLLEALAGDGVDAGIGRGGDDLVAALAQNGDGLRADQTGAADHDDLHSDPLVCSPQTRTTRCSAPSRNLPLLLRMRGADVWKLLQYVGVRLETGRRTLIFRQEREAIVDDVISETAAVWVHGAL